MRKNNPMLVHCKDWENLIYELTYTYTTSIKKVCRLLKCDRKWVDRYIRPHVHYVYISNGKGKDSVDYLFIASVELNKVITESVWLNTFEFEELIIKYITDCTRQTINVPIELLIESKNIQSFQEVYKATFDKIEIAKKSKKYEELAELYNYKNTLTQNNLSDIGKKIYTMLPNPYKRTNSKEIDCPIPSFKLSELQAVHDMMDYGDSAEEVYRTLFKKGCYKLKLHIPDKDGCVSDKVYYLRPKENIEIGYESVNSILINYSDYIKFFL